MTESSLSSLLSDSIVGSILQRVVPRHGSFHTPTHKLRVCDDDPNAEQLRETKPVDPARRTKVSASTRERCRANQAKYRQRQREFADEMDATITELREAIEALEEQRDTIVAHVPTNQSLWVVVTEYFRLFRRGYLMTLLALDPSPSEAAVRRAGDAHAQLDFLKEAMALDVTDGDARGAETILEQWRLFSLCHGDVSVQLHRLELVSDQSIVAVTTTSITITDNTLRVLYPHLTGTDRFAVAGKLLNKRLVVEGSTETKLKVEWCGSSPRWT